VATISLIGPRARLLDPGRAGTFAWPVSNRAITGRDRPVHITNFIQILLLLNCQIRINSKFANKAFLLVFFIFLLMFALARNAFSRKSCDDSLTSNGRNQALVLSWLESTSRFPSRWNKTRDFSKSSISSPASSIKFLRALFSSSFLTCLSPHSASLIPDNYVVFSVFHLTYVINCDDFSFFYIFSTPDSICK